ncbi:ABC transporter permease subunit [Escherichia coli]
MGVLFQSGVPMPLAILLTLLLGALCGLINAGLIIYTKVNPLVITLGTLYLLLEALCCFPGWPERRGTKVLVDSRWRLQISANLDVLGLPVPLIIFLICLLVFWLWLHKTHAGRNVFLIGQSPRVALYSAIPVNRTLCALYAMTGLASAVAAVLLVSYFGSARSDLGASVSDARHHRRGAWRGQYLWWFRFRIGTAIALLVGIFATRFANGRSAKSGVQRPFRCATYRRCRRSFR